MAEERCKLTCRHDGVELSTASIEFGRPHVVLEFTLKVGRAAAGTLIVDTASINPMLVSLEHSKELYDAVAAFKTAVERVFIKYHGVLITSNEEIDEGADPVEV